jgi:hypothetical protein
VSQDLISLKVLRFEVLTVMKMSIVDFWVVAPCSGVGGYSASVEHTDSIFRMKWMSHCPNDESRKHL